jgi:hypothetical protein
MILRDQLVQRGLRLDRFMSFLRMGAIHIGFLLLMTGELGVYLLLSPFVRVRSMYRAFSSAIEASEKDKWPPKVATIRVTRPTAPRLLQESNPTETQQRPESRCGSGIACGKRGRRKDEFEHLICQQAEGETSPSFLFD